jgi:1-acyl-sn-glycerol-3-phosphate acyltransferase
VARLAIESGAPVIPVVMVGTDEAQKLGQVIPKPKAIGVIFGEPLDFSRYAGQGNDRYILRAVADEITLATLRITDQEFVDTYAQTAKARLKAERKAAEEEKRN